MPKLSVSVPDELWDSVRSKNPEWGASKTVQAGLEALLRQSGYPFGITAAALSAVDGFQELASRMEAEGEEAYMAGASRALRTLARLGVGYSDLAELARLAWDVPRWLEERFSIALDEPVDLLVTDGHPDLEFCGLALAAFGLDWDGSSGTYKHPGHLYAKGAMDAAQLLFARVSEGQREAPATERGQ